MAKKTSIAKRVYALFDQLARRAALWIITSAAAIFPAWSLRDYLIAYDYFMETLWSRILIESIYFVMLLLLFYKKIRWNTALIICIVSTCLWATFLSSIAPLHVHRVGLIGIGFIFIGAALFSYLSAKALALISAITLATLLLFNLHDVERLHHIYSEGGIILITAMLFSIGFAIFRDKWIKRYIKNYLLLQEVHEELNQAHKALKKAHKSIQDSILYASYIQQAILPSNAYCSKALGEHFILYLPKEAVSGDFYWVYQEDNKVFFAACDCTGHSVPGALMSMICNNILNQLVIEQRLHSPAAVLTEARKRITQIFSRGAQTPRPDGMDCALCLWDKTTSTLTFAGANRPLFLCRSQIPEPPITHQQIKQWETFENLFIIQGDKMSVSYEEHTSKAFSEITFPIHAGDVVYLCSDGFTHQIGGSKGRTLGLKRFLKLLHQFHTLPLLKQKHLFHDALREWQGKHPQTDDILLMGIRISFSPSP